MSTTDRISELRVTDALAFLWLLYGNDAPGHLVRFTAPNKGSCFHPAEDLEGFACQAVPQARTQNVYFGICLQDRDAARRLADESEPGSGKRTRGFASTTVAIPGFYDDIDIRGPAHAQTELPPTLEEALRLLEGFPLPPSLIVDTGYGLHSYWLFKELWIFENGAERDQAADLNRRLQAWIRDAAAGHQWVLEPTADLARLLRLPGTRNLKPGLEPVLVRVLKENAYRYTADDFDFLPPVPCTRASRRAQSRRNGKVFPLAHVEPIHDGCAWFRHCIDDAAKLPEPEWYAMLDLCGRCENGQELAHAYSQPYPNYTWAETDAKLAHARQDSPGAPTCKHIHHLTHGAYCDSCAHRGTIASPINLGSPTDRPPHPVEDASIVAQAEAPTARDRTPEALILKEETLHAMNNNQRTTAKHNGAGSATPDSNGSKMAEDAHEPAAENNANEEKDPPRRRRPPLWSRWVVALAQAKAKLLWTDTREAYFQLSTGEILPLYSDEAALWLQQRTDRAAAYRSDLFTRAAGALRSWIAQHGTHVVVFRQARVDWTARTVWIGCEGGQKLYRITHHGIELLPNGTDGALILGGCAPVLDLPVKPTGELARWLTEDTWATPPSRLALAILTPMLVLGAQAFDARPLILVRGPTNSGKTTRMEMLGDSLHSLPTIAQKIKRKDEENESRIVNERLAIFDNLDTPPRDVDAENFLTTACTQRFASIRKMRVEGEVVVKLITAFVVVTSFSMPACLKRSDVINRGVLLEFQRPNDAKSGKKSDRRPKREALWGDALTLLQTAMANWERVPKTSDHRSIEFVQFAHALLPATDADGLEQHLIGLQGNLAALDNPILDALEARTPDGPMTAAELYALWWPVGAYGNVVNDGGPKNAYALGSKLGHLKGGRLGDWIVRSDEQRPARWTFERQPAFGEFDAGLATTLLWQLVDPEP